MTVDRTPKPCLHTRVQHEHGHRTTYWEDRCRCEPCLAANARYARRRRKLSAWGRTPGGMTDPAPVLAHLQRLQDAGLGRHQIAARAGVDNSTIHNLIYGRKGKPPARRIATKTSQRLLAVALPDVDQLAPSALIEGIGTRRRLQALVAIGWSQVDLAEKLGWSRENLYRVIHGYGGSGKVFPTTRRAVVDLYGRLWSVAPPGGPRRTRALDVASSRRWLPPLAWDDETIDDPAATPVSGADRDLVDDVAVERACKGDLRVPLNRVEMAAALALCEQRGMSYRDTAELLGVSDRLVWRFRANRSALPHARPGRTSAA